ncbi:MAG: hypothetical protein ACTSRW_14855 [Candidatus Helarchaeota archaeon]
MLVSFPHMGNCWPAFKCLCESCGAEVFLPQTNNTKQLEIGLKHSPEWVCFPFKVTLSNFFEALEHGVDAIAMATDCGPCRFGFYYAVQQKILEDLGFEFEMLHLPQGDLLTFEWADFLKNMAKKCGNTLHNSDIVKIAQKYLCKAQLIQECEKLEGLTRCYEVNKGDTTRTLKKMIPLIDQANKMSELRNVRRRISREFAAIETRPHNGNALRVGLTGEIQVTLDPFVNHDIKRKLGELGCEVHMDLSLYDWMKHKFHLNFHRKYIEYLSKTHKDIGGIQMDIGGEAFWVLGEYINWAQKGFNGFVHIYPFTCMPEITAKSIITKWYGDGRFDLPPAFFGFDEHAGEAGLVTRLEAYVELLKQKKERKQHGNGSK